MSSLMRTAHRSFLSYSSKTLIHKFPHHHSTTLQPSNPVSTFLSQTKPYVSEPTYKSPFEANIIRILCTEIEYQSNYAPPHQPVTKFNSFTIHDRPGEQWITMRGKFGDDETIKIEATMFDGFETVPRLGDNSGEEDLRLHLSLLIDISKGDESNDLEFVCSAWPDSLEVQKVYILERYKNKRLGRPYVGPDFRKLNCEVQKEFRKYLARRGLDNELTAFLHQYMMNKDRIELIQWLGNVQSFVER